MHAPSSRALSDVSSLAAFGSEAELGSTAAATSAADGGARGVVASRGHSVGTSGNSEIQPAGDGFGAAGADAAADGAGGSHDGDGSKIRRLAAELAPMVNSKDEWSAWLASRQGMLMATGLSAAAAAAIGVYLLAGGKRRR